MRLVVEAGMHANAWQVSVLQHKCYLALFRPLYQLFNQTSGMASEATP